MTAQVGQVQSAKRQSFGDRLRSVSPIELVALVIILIVAFALRVWDLTGFPPGLHGDEGITGLEGLRFLEDGHIGIYTRSALGQPTAPFYLSGLSIAVLGETVFAIRFVSVLAGVLTVAATYGVARRRYGSVVALTSASVLAVMVWHLDYSRIAFGLIWWPLVTLAAVALLDRAIASRQLSTWAVAGAVTSFGVYVYNSHWMAGLAIAMYVVGWSVVNYRAVVAGRWRELVAFGGTALVVLGPMLAYMRNDANDYGSHIRTIGLRSTDEWLTAGLGGKLRLLVEGYGHAVDVLFFRPEVDFVDASGVYRPVQLVVVAAAVLGAITVVRRSSVFGQLLVLIMFILPIASALTVGGGEIRRDFAAAPMLAIMAGIGITTAVGWLSSRNQTAGLFAIAAIAWQLLVPVVGFLESSDHPTRQWVFAAEIIEPVAIAEEFQDEVFVNFYSHRHSLEYESIQYLAPDLVGTNRSDEFSEEPGILLIDSAGRDNLFVLVGDYVTLLPELQLAYPAGHVVASGLSGGIAYEVFRVDITS